MPYYDYDDYDDQDDYEFYEIDDDDQEFGDPKPNRKLKTKKPPVRKPPARRPAAQPPKKQAKKSPVKTPPRFTLTADNSVFNSSSDYRGTEQGNGIGLSSYSNPLSIDFPPPPPSPIKTALAKQSRTDSLFGIASQLISGFSRNPTTQTANGQTPIYNAPYSQQSAGGSSNYQPSLNAENGAGANVGASLGGGFDGIVSWASNNPWIILGGAVGLFLLFREPPRSRR